MSFEQKTKQTMYEAWCCSNIEPYPTYKDIATLSSFSVTARNSETSCEDHLQRRG